MRHSSMVLGALAGLAAPVAGVMAYQSWAPGPARASDPVAPTTSSAVGTTAPVVRYRRCKSPAQLEEDVCVTHRVRIVVAPLTALGSGPADSPVGSVNDVTPTHPVHPLPTHEVDPVDDPTGEPTGGPGVESAVEPTAPPSCVASDDESEESEESEEGAEGAEGERTHAGLLGQVASLASGPELVPSVAASESDCADDDEDDEDEDEDAGDDGDAD